MIEAKDIPWIDKPRQQQILRDLLTALTPGKDYHWMSLNPDLLADFDVVGKQFRIPITFFEVKKFAKLVTEHGYAGLGGHYLLLSNTVRDQLAPAGQQLGVGFPASENALRRELLRDVQWIFTNDIERLGAAHKALLAAI